MPKIAKKIHVVLGVSYINEFSFLQIIGLCERVIGVCTDVVFRHIHKIVKSDY